MTCSACTVQTGVIAVPSDAIKALWAPTFTNVSGVSTWDAVTPATMDLHGGSLAGNLYAAGLGNGPISTDPITGIKTVPTDPTITPKIAAFTALTDGATVTWPIASGYFANTELTFTTHGGSRTLNITSPLSGGSYVLWLKQDSTGGEGLTLGTGCTWKVINGGAGVVNLSTAANAVDVLAFTYDGTSCFATLGKNYN